jgi:TonB family protein
MSWIYYLLEANFYLVIFYLLYYFIFRKETHYQLNRAYLLISSFLAFVIPFVQFGFLRPEIKAVTFTILAGQATIKDAAPSVTSAWTISEYLLMAYLLISCLLLVNLCIKIYKLMRLSRINKNTVVDSYKLVEITGGNDAFSFFNNVFISGELTSNQTVIRHELVHVTQKHSWDIIFFEILKIINWFNPLVYMMQHSIKELHEFIADSETVTYENSTTVYADFLINNAYGINENVLTNTLFNKSLLKKRIIMLYQKPSGKSARLKYLLVLPVCAGLLCASTLGFSKTYSLVDLAPGHNEKEKNTTSLPAVTSDNRITSTTKQVDKVFTTVQHVPEFPGGINAFYRFLGHAVHYPKSARENGTQGRVIIKMIVEKDGSLSHITIARGVSKDIDKEAIRAMSTSPKWKPGTQNGKLVRVAYALPISFTLAE